MKTKILAKQHLFLSAILFFVQFNLFANNLIVTCASITTWNGIIWDNGAPDITKNAVFIADYTINTNFTACAISVTTNATVTVVAGINLILENEVNVASGSNLVFENTASLLQNNSTAINTGNIIYKRDTTPMIQYQYTYWGAPVAGQVLNVFSPLTNTNRYYTYNASIAVNNWVSENATNAMAAGKGYAIMAPSNYTSTQGVYNGTFIGTPNNGTISVNVEAFDPVEKNYNFIANPYPSAIDVVTLIDNTNLGTLYFWTHNTAISGNVFTTNDYAIRTRTTGTVALSGGAVPDQYVAAGQGFFASAGATTTINFTNAMRVSNNNTQFYRATQSEPLNYYIHLNLTNIEGAFKQIAVGYLEGATNAYDFGADALGSTEGVVQFYSLIPPASYGFGIQARAYPWNETDVIPLGYSTTIAGDYTIAIDHYNAFFDDKDIYLEDTSNGTFHNLKTNTFTFTAAVGTFNERFKLHYRDASLAIDDNLINNEALSIYTVTETIKFLAKNINISTIEAFDVTGRLLFRETNINDVLFEKNISLANQTLFISVILENGQKVRRKIIL